VDADGKAGGDAMNIDEFIRWAENLAEEERKFNEEAKKWKPTNPLFGDALQTVYDLSGSRKFDRIAGWLRQARKEAGG
jgi:hypothetical protein